ncbi:MAG: polysaccharide deacetylase [Deltaproteobacteria bacterium]|nr:polysaccharide deacetylase [Deltaproteobacteria bacterium]
MTPPLPKSPRIPPLQPGKRRIICPLSPAHVTGFAAFHLYVILLFADIRMAPLPLIAFLLACAFAPFFPRFGFFLPIVGRGNPGEKGVALTFDDGPDPKVTPLLLDLLDRHSVSATFFVTGERAARHPSIIRDILSRGHAIGNHSYHHFPFLMLKGVRTLRREIESTQSVLAGYGVVPMAFRPPVGITNPLLWRVLLEQGMFCVNYSCRAVDLGNRRIGRLSEKVLKAVSPGDIVALHDVAPQRAGTDRLMAEFDALLRGLKEKGQEVVPLGRLIGREVMRSGESPGEVHPAALFYDGLAADYDREQFCSPVSIVRKTEYALFEARLPSLFFPTDRVLEIGAGTGIFTLAIARRCQEVTAVDISASMLGILKGKAAAEGLGNIRTIAANAESMDLEGSYTVACAFSSLEYLADLRAFFRRLADRIEPGGTVYFITARRSLFRLFAQIGNAMRQGVWLKAHNRREIEAILSASGFDEIRISSHLFKSWVSGGILLEVVARRRIDPSTLAGL